MTRTIAELLSATNAIGSRINSRIDLMAREGEKFMTDYNVGLKSVYTSEHAQQRESDAQELTRIREEIAPAADAKILRPEMQPLLAAVQKASEAVLRERFAEVWFKQLNASWPRVAPLAQRFEAIAKLHDVNAKKWEALSSDVTKWPIQKIMEAAAQCEEEENTLQKLFSDMLALASQDCKCAETLSALVDGVTNLISKTQMARVGVAACYRLYQEKGGKAS